MEPRREDIDLAVELRALRPTPRPEFTADLDSRAHAGFPDRPPASGGPLGRVVSLFRGPARHRVPALAGALAASAIAVATAVIAFSEEPHDTITAQRSAPAGKTGPRYLEGAAHPGKPRRPRGFDASLGSHLESAAASAGLERSVARAADSTPLRSGSGPHAFDAPRRDVERSAQLVLSTEPSEVRPAAARVLETVHAHDGIVLRSSIAADDRAAASAVFELLIPSGRLGDALAGFSEIADVRSRRESTGDVTGRTTGLEERIRDSRARIAGLLTELASADTETSRNAVEAQLRSERGRLAALRSALQGLERRVSLSHVSLRIESGSAESGDDGSWGISSAVDDAGRILAIAAGVTLIGLAVLAPLALLAALAWFGWRALARRRREGVLD